MEIDLLSTTFDCADDIKEAYPELTSFEALTIASRIIRNEIITNGLGVFFNDDNPHYLEAISISINEVAESINNLQSVLK